MRTELEELRTCLKLAERRAEMGNDATREIHDAQEAFESLVQRYESLQGERAEEQDVRKVNWHLTVPADLPFDAVMARIFAEALRRLPWPRGIVVRFLPSCETGYRINHEFAVHHESLDVGRSMRVIE